MERCEVYESVARNLEDLVAKDQPTAATPTSVDASSLIHPESGQLKGYEAFFYAGQGSGNSRVISDFEPANNRFLVAQPLNPTPSSNSLFFIFQSFGNADYLNAFNRAIGICKALHLDEKVATMQLIATQSEYPVPSGFIYINTLRLVPSGSSDYQADDEVDSIFELSPKYWRIEANPLGTYQIVFDSRQISLSNFNETWVRVMGQAKPDFATIPTDLEDYVIAHSTAFLAIRKIAENEEWKNKYTAYAGIARGLERSVYTPRRGKKVG